ncbi:MAG: hypothetical protein A2583_07130 [Bdellovibrionales bacterium RIFOXYD1_FULL_53_11]|nr:MAG: hypothetical protein A2583_07130 [Bdellovibrionales bacterium RIFOXYD1_FULL_53_11]
MDKGSVNSFKVKGVAKDLCFFNRKKEIKALLDHAAGGQHTLLLAPRRFGKSSLLRKVAALASRQGCIKEMFYDKKRAFYQSAIRMDLGFAPVDEAGSYLLSMFDTEDNKVAASLCAELAQMTKGHPYYVQLAGYCLWELYRAAGDWKKVSAQDVFLMIYDLERTTFENSISLLTPQQRQVYRAIASDPGKQLTSRGFLVSHALPGHSSVRKAVAKLEASGFVLKGGGGYYSADPVLGTWWASAVG